MKERYISTNGITLHTIEAGPEEGPLVILLHGFPEFAYSWHEQLEYLAGLGYHVLAPDQRGYNLSDKPAKIKDYSVSELVADIIGLIDNCKQEKAIVVGHDWGALVTWSLAMEHPERLYGIVTMNVPHPKVFLETFGHEFNQTKRSWYMVFFQLPGFRKLCLNAITGKQALSSCGSRV